MTANTVVLETPASVTSSAGPKLPFTEVSNRRAIQTNNVEVDERGYIYIVDRANPGLHILEHTGPPRAITDWNAAACRKLTRAPILEANLSALRTLSAERVDPSMGTRKCSYMG